MSTTWDSDGRVTVDGKVMHEGAQGASTPPERGGETTTPKVSPKKKKAKHGGRRKGAGRPKKAVTWGDTPGARTHQVPVKVNAEELAKLDSLAEEGESRPAVFRRLLEQYSDT